MAQGTCFTCLGFRQGCSASGCVNAATIPRDALCQDCLNMRGRQKEPPNLLVCGLNHRKPAVQDVALLMEAWIPGFSSQALGAPIAVNFTEYRPVSMLDKVKDRGTGPSPEFNLPRNNEKICEKTQDKKEEIIYDTHMGTVRPVDHKRDVFADTPNEESSYVMQLLSFRNQQVLTLFDSGANQNFVQAKLAKDAGFRDLPSKPATINVAGGGEISTEHGEYMAVLGPSQDGLYHRVRCQAVEQITRPLPLVELDDIAEEARMVLPPSTRLPSKIGGDEVKLIIGIGQTRLAPRMTHSLPSGICIFESKIKDIFGSQICFGGPHQAFTRAYQKLGINLQANYLQVLLKEIATAYIDGPQVFMCKETPLSLEEAEDDEILRVGLTDVVNSVVLNKKQQAMAVYRAQLQEPVAIQLSPLMAPVPPAPAPRLMVLAPPTPAPRVMVPAPPVPAPRLVLSTSMILSPRVLAPVTSKMQVMPANTERRLPNPMYQDRPSRPRRRKPVSPLNVGPPRLRSVLPSRYWNPPPSRRKESRSCSQGRGPDSGVVVMSLMEQIARVVETNVSAERFPELREKIAAALSTGGHTPVT